MGARRIPTGGSGGTGPELSTAGSRIPALLRRTGVRGLLALAVCLPVVGLLSAIELDRTAVNAEESQETLSFLNLTERASDDLFISMRMLLTTLEQRLDRTRPASDSDLDVVLDRWRSVVGGHVQALVRLGADGRIVASSGEVPAALEALPLHEADIDGRTVLRILPSSTSDGWDGIVVAFRAVRLASGRQDGYLAAAFDPAALQAFYRTLELGPRGAVFLLGADGTIAAGTTTSLAAAGVPAAWGAAARRMERTGPAEILSGPTAGETRIAAARPVGDTPFTTLLVRDSTSAIAAWRARALAMGVLAGIPLLVACGLAAAAFRQAGALRRQSRIFADQAGTLATTLESVDDAIIAFDPEGRISIANRAAVQLLAADARPDEAGEATGKRLAGHQLSEFGLRWRTAAEADSPDPRADRAGADLVDDLVRRACAGERIGPVELAAFTTRGGDPLRLVATLRMIPGLAHATAGVVLVLHDRTGERAIEERLRQSEKMQAIGQLTGGVAHDFNNLLLVILGGAEELAERLDHDPATRRTAALISQAAERGAALTRRLLAFARRQTLAPRIVDITLLLNDSLPLLARTAGASVSVALQVAPDAWCTRIDPEQLVVALVNLVANARDAMPGGGRVTISVANETLGPREHERDEAGAGDHIAIRVSDTGMGMTADVRARAIDPFFSTKGPGAGTGLGLSMVYGFVRQSGGRMRIDSQPGAGARVSLLLPRALDATAADAREAPADTACPTGTERVLVMEPDPLLSTRLADLLVGLGYRVECTASPAEALDRIVAGAPFDLLITDAEQPDGLDGPGLARLARARQPDLAVLLTTATGPGGERPHSDTGALILVAKPWHRAEIARQIRAVLSART